jgi:hypothetical protein
VKEVLLYSMHRYPNQTSKGTKMKSSAIAVLLLSCFSVLTAQDHYTITAGNAKIDMKCTAYGALCKDAEITANIPIRIFFRKNDKSDMDVSGKSVHFTYKKDERGDDVADVTVDGQSWWSTRCIFLVTAYVDVAEVSLNDEKLSLGNSWLDLNRLGFPFSVSRLTSKN